MEEAGRKWKIMALLHRSVHAGRIGKGGRQQPGLGANGKPPGWWWEMQGKRVPREKQLSFWLVLPRSNEDSIKKKVPKHKKQPLDRLGESETASAVDGVAGQSKSKPRGIKTSPGSPQKLALNDSDVF